MSIETVRITRVSIQDKNKEGKSYVTKTGKPFWKVGIMTDKFEEKWLSSLAFSPDDLVLKLQEGDEKVIVVNENNGFLNFNIPTKADLLESRVDSLENKIKQIITKIKEIDPNKPQVVNPAGVIVPLQTKENTPNFETPKPSVTIKKTDEIDVNDIPW